MNDNNRITRRDGLKVAGGLTAIGGVGAIAYAATGSESDENDPSDSGGNGGSGSDNTPSKKHHPLEVAVDCVKRRGRITVHNPNEEPVTVLAEGPDGYEQYREIEAGGTAAFGDLIDGEYHLATDPEKYGLEQSTVMIDCTEKEPTDLTVSYRCVDTQGQITITNPNRFEVAVLVTGPDDYEEELVLEPGETVYLPELADGTYEIHVDHEEVAAELETIDIECPEREWHLLGESPYNPEADVDTENVMRLYAAYTKQYYFYRVELKDPWADPAEDHANFGIGFDFEPETDFYQYQLNWSSEEGFFHHVDATDRQAGLPDGITGQREDTDEGAIFTFTIDRKEEPFGFPDDGETYKYVANAGYGGATHANISTDPSRSWGGYDNETFEWDRNQWFLETTVDVFHPDKKKQPKKG